MIKLPALLRRLARGRDGTMAIETAFVTPLLLLMALGSFQVSSMVARQSELQTAAQEAAAIGLAQIPQTSEDLDTIAGILRASTGLAEDEVDVTLSYRCGNDEDRVASSATCDENDQVWTFVTIRLATDYRPIWTRWGIGSDVPLTVERTVQVS